MTYPDYKLYCLNIKVNEELMLANGMNMETIKAVTDAASGYYKNKEHGRTTTDEH